MARWWAVLMLAACGSDAGSGDSALDSGEGSAGASVPSDLRSCFFDVTCPFALSTAHRGAALYAPENTIPGMEEAISRGADAIEVDVRTTADGVLVLMHDGTVDRTTDGSGNVGEMTWAELQALTVTHPVDGESGAPIPTFREMLAAGHGRVVFDLDVKSADAAALVADVLAEDMADSVFAGVKDVDKAESYRALAPEMAIMPNVDDPESLRDYAHLSPELVEVDWLELDVAAPVAADVGARMFTHVLGFEGPAVAAGTEAESWGVLLDGGAAVIQTDFVDELDAVLSAENAARADAGATWAGR